MVEKHARKESPALLALMSTLYCCCSTRSRAMLFSFSTIRLPRWPHSTSRRASPGSTRTLASAASAPKSFLHSAALPAGPPRHHPTVGAALDMYRLQRFFLTVSEDKGSLEKQCVAQLASLLTEATMWCTCGLPTMGQYEGCPRL